MDDLQGGILRRRFGGSPLNRSSRGEAAIDRDKYRGSGVTDVTDLSTTERQLRQGLPHLQTLAADAEAGLWPDLQALSGNRLLTTGAHPVGAVIDASQRIIDLGEQKARARRLRNQDLVITRDVSRNGPVALE